MARKTVNVKDLLDRVNAMNAASGPAEVKGREALNVLIERVLMDAGHYQGFRFTFGADDPADETRRHYYTAAGLA